MFGNALKRLLGFGDDEERQPQSPVRPQPNRDGGQSRPPAPRMMAPQPDQSANILNIADRMGAPTPQRPGMYPYGNNQKILFGAQIPQFRRDIQEDSFTFPGGGNYQPTSNGINIDGGVYDPRKVNLQEDDFRFRRFGR